MGQAKAQQCGAEQAEFERAVEECAPDLERYRAAQLFLNKLAPGTKEFSRERLYIQELYERIDARARRIELPDREVDGVQLVEFAQAMASRRAGIATIGTRGGAKHLADQYQRCITATADAQRAYNLAEQTLRDAKRREQAALEAYQAHGASKLVRA